MPEDLELNIRAAIHSDVFATEGIRREVGWEKAPSDHIIWPDTDEDWSEHGYYKEIVAEIDGVIAGKVGLEAYVPPFARMVDLAVRPDYQRRGIGRKLIKACCVESARRGFTALYLQTETNNTAAHALYKSLGFLQTAHGRMLRMIHFLDYPLIANFCRTHPLYNYSCDPSHNSIRDWLLKWSDYLTRDNIVINLNSGSTRGESSYLLPSFPAIEFFNSKSELDFKAELELNAERDLEPGHHFEVVFHIENRGSRHLEGVLQFLIPMGILLKGPEWCKEKTLELSVLPGKKFSQSITFTVDPYFENSLLNRLNCPSMPISCRLFFNSKYAILSQSLHIATPFNHS